MPRRPLLTRRHFGQLGLAGLVGMGLHGRSARADTSGSRRYLFLFARGGWDFSYTFAHLADNENIDTDADGYQDEAHDIPFVWGDKRESVSDFFQNWGDRACVINGIEVPSITHTRCTRLAFTGTTSPDADDFPSILAANSSDTLLLPHIVLSGPTYNARFGSQVVRVGDNGQLPAIIDGTIFESSDMPVTLPDEGATTLVDAFLREQAAARAALGRAGQPGEIDMRFAQVLEQATGLGDSVADIDLTATSNAGKAAAAVELLASGHSRCALIEHLGEFDQSWDTHASNQAQGAHFNRYFEVVNAIIEDLASRPGHEADSLLDEVTVVCFSEMGRFPKLNGQMGKDHWPFTSAMLVGAGVNGGRVVGAFQDDLTGAGVDLASGELSDSGERLNAGHLGATLLAMGDVDPEEFTNEDPIAGIYAD